MRARVGGPERRDLSCQIDLGVADKTTREAHSRNQAPFWVAHQDFLRPQELIEAPTCNALSSGRRFLISLFPLLAITFGVSRIEREIITGTTFRRSLHRKITIVEKFHLQTIDAVQIAR